MNLPPSIAEMILEHWAHTSLEEDLTVAYDLACRIAHEACRLQREADNLSQDTVLLTTPLVVPGWLDEPPVQSIEEHEPTPIDLSKYPRCPVCRTTGHTHSKTCCYAGMGLLHHVKPEST